MPDTKRLVAKLDEAHAALKPQRRKGDDDGSRFAAELRRRFVAGRPFEIVIGGRAYPVRCDDVRISKTTIDLGLHGVDGTIPLTRVTTCQHGEDKEGGQIMGFGVYENDDRVTPIAIA